MAADIGHLFLAAGHEADGVVEQGQRFLPRRRRRALGSVPQQPEQFKVLNALARGLPAFGGYGAPVGRIDRTVFIAGTRLAKPESAEL